MRRKGVSSVVGTIFIVFLVFLLSFAVIVVVLDFVRFQKVHFVSFALSKNNSEYELRLMAGAEEVENCTCYREGFVIGNFWKNDVGKSIVFNSLPGERVYVVCKFLDGSEQIVFSRII
ncbi:MAG: hypothetical protein QXN34_03750 [Archaeoglobaceae archaeon]